MENIQPALILAEHLGVEGRDHGNTNAQGAKR